MTDLTVQFNKIAQLFHVAEARTYHLINREMVTLYWGIGKFIYNEIENSGWGKQTVKQLAVFLESEHRDSKGFSARNLFRMKQFYECYKDFPKLSPLVTEISWSNHLNILSKTTSMEEKEFYLQLCADKYYSKRDFASIIDSGTYERVMIANKKLPSTLLDYPSDPSGVFKDIYMFDFVALKENYKEYDLKKALIENFKRFLLEMGPDFSFIDEEFVVQVGMKDFKIDLLLHSRKLNCLCCIEIKITEFQPEYLGKLEFYLEALDKNVKQPHENPSIGILICKTKDEEVVKYALNRSMSPAMIAKYETNLIPKEVLQKKLHELSEIIEDNEDLEDL